MNDTPSAPHQHQMSNVEDGAPCSSTLPRHPHLLNVDDTPYTCTPTTLNIERQGWHPPLFHSATSNGTGCDAAPSSTLLTAAMEVVDDIPHLPPPLASTQVTDPYDHTRLYHRHQC